MVTLIPEKQARSTLKHYMMMMSKMMMMIDEKNEAQQAIQGHTANWQRR